MTSGALRRFLFGTLRGRLILGVAVVHAVMMTLVVVDLTLRQRVLLLDRQAEQATALSRSLATSGAGWIAADDVSGLQELVEAQRRYPELLFAMLTDDRGRVLAHSDPTRQGLYVQDLPREARPTVLSRTAALVDVATPAEVGGRHVGWARVGIGQSTARERLAQITRSGVAYALAAIVLGSLFAWLVGSWSTRRLYAVQGTINEVRAGHRLARSTLTGSDEAATLGHEFNSMLDALAERDAELRAGKEKYQRLIQRIQAAVVVHGADTRILTSNALAWQLLGLTEQQLLGKAGHDPAWHFLREDGSEMPPEEYPVNSVVATGRPLRDAIVGVRRPDPGGDVWVLVSADPVTDGRGALDQVIVTFVDITARRQAEEARRRLNRELRAVSACNQTLLRAVDEPTLLHEICRIVCDEAGYRMAWVGYVEHDEARTIRPVAWAGVESGYVADAKLSWSDETERGRGPAGVAARSGELVCVEDFAVDSTMAPWRASAVERGYRSGIALPLKDDVGAVFGVFLVYSSEAKAVTPDEVRLLEELAGDLAFGILVLRDRNELKRAVGEILKLNTDLEQRVHQRTVQLEAANRDLESFAYSVSHDLRAPLRSITGFSEALREDCSERLDDQGREYVERVQKAALRMNQLIDDLLKLSRLTRGELKRETVSLSALAGAIADELKKADAARRVEVVIQPGVTANGDPRLLQIVLENLMRNAWKFTSRHPTARIELGLATIDGEPTYFVRDDGAGFDMAYVANLFVPFQRLHGGAEFAGSGIGLSIVQRIVQRHGGRVWAEGEVERGATLYFTLPA